MDTIENINYVMSLDVKGVIIKLLFRKLLEQARSQEITLIYENHAKAIAPWKRLQLIEELIYALENELENTTDEEQINQINADIKFFREEQQAILREEYLKNKDEIK